MCSKDQLLGETGVSEERGSLLAARAGLWITACVPGASCGVGRVSISSPNLVCMGVCVSFTSKLQAGLDGE